MRERCSTQAHKVCPLQNPRYDIFVTEDGRRKKLKKVLPPGLSAHDERVLKTVQRKAYRYEWWIGMFFSISSRISEYAYFMGYLVVRDERVLGQQQNLRRLCLLV